MSVSQVKYMLQEFGFLNILSNAAKLYSCFEFYPVKNEEGITI